MLPRSNHRRKWLGQQSVPLLLIIVKNFTKIYAASPLSCCSVGCYIATLKFIRKNMFIL